MWGIDIDHTNRRKATFCPNYGQRNRKCLSECLQFWIFETIDIIITQHTIKTHMMKRRILSLSRLATLMLPVALLTLGSLTACDDDDDETIAHTIPTTPTKPETSTVDATTVEANRFIYETMGTYYYWLEDMPDLDYKKQTDTEEYFYNLLSDKDRFSFISDDADATWSEFDGVYTDMGWEYTLMYADASKTNIIALIDFVYPNTPAAESGAKRGDMIETVNGTTMTLNNYRSLIQSSTGTFAGTRVDAEGTETAISFDLTAREITENYVAKVSIIDQPDGKKVGYLLYNSYSSAYNKDLIEAFRTMKEAGVDDVVLDLRLNTGGDVDCLVLMCSLLAPAADVAAKKELQYYEFNSLLSKYPEYSREASAVHFVDTLDVNMDLNRLMVLVSGNTYSASESTIWSLEPYMDVQLVGETTGGKNSMMYVMTPEDFVNSKTSKPYYDTAINNWLIAPIVAICSNSTGESFDTSDGKGLDPDYAVNEYSGVMSHGLRELGDPEETLLAAALRYLSTGSYEESKEDASTDESETKSLTNSLRGSNAMMRSLDKRKMPMRKRFSLTTID